MTTFWGKKKPIWIWILNEVSHNVCHFTSQAVNKILLQNNHFLQSLMKLFCFSEADETVITEIRSKRCVLISYFWYCLRRKHVDWKKTLKKLKTEVWSYHWTSLVFVTRKSTSSRYHVSRYCTQILSHPDIASRCTTGFKSNVSIEIYEQLAFF